jgi:tetratricopeptide (TPR) repeat protein
LIGIAEFVARSFNGLACRVLPAKPWRIVMRTALLIGLLAAAPAAAFAQNPAPQPQPQAHSDGQEVTVTGRRIQDYRDRLAACIARHCPPNEDVDATLALAEVEFESGAYAEARGTILQSLGRNRRHARAFPEPVADLYRSRARVARHLGRGDEALRSTLDTLRTLDAGIPTEDYRHFTARLEVAEAYTRAGRLEAARDELSGLARLARAGNRPDVASIAELRGTWISYLLAPYGDARSRLLEMSRDPSNRMRAVGAQILLARIYRDQGDARQADALVAQLAQRDTGRRALVYSPPYVLAARETIEEGGTVNVNTRIPDVYDGQWIDVGFWVMPDGSVDGLELIRQRGTPDWAEPLLRSIRGRRYTVATDNTPTFRLERYTYTADLEQVSGTRIMQRSQRARVEYYDLSTGEPPPDVVIPEHPPTPAARPTAG